MKFLDSLLTRWGIPVVLFCLVAALSHYWISVESQRMQEAERNMVLSKAIAVRAQLEGELNSTASLATGLAAYVAVEDAITEKRATRILTTLHRYGRHIRVLSVAPDNTISHVYPLNGNEKAIGLEFGDEPEQRASVEKAMRTHASVMAGPVRLVQGGVGLVNQTPVFRDSGEYWGVLSTVIDSDRLFDAIGIGKAPHGVEYALRGKDGLGPDGAVFFGSAEHFSRDPVLMTVAVPGGSWQIAALPVGGWQAAGQAHFVLFHMLGIGSALLVAFLTWAFLLERWKARMNALRDPLTGLPNRRLAVYRLEVEVARCDRLGKKFAVVFIDLDGFKPVNDQFGHRAGDAVLQEIAKAIRGVVRKSDLVARLGSDEFLVILSDIDPISAALAVAAKVQAAIRRPVELGILGVQAQLDASIGVSIFPDNGRTVDALVGSADEAMCQAKRDGKGVIRTVDESMRAFLQARRAPMPALEQIPG